MSNTIQFELSVYVYWPSSCDLSLEKGGTFVMKIMSTVVDVRHIH